MQREPLDEVVVVELDEVLVGRAGTMACTRSARVESGVRRPGAASRVAARVPSRRARCPSSASPIARPKCSRMRESSRSSRARRIGCPDGGRGVVDRVVPSGAVEGDRDVQEYVAQAVFVGGVPGIGEAGDEGHPELRQLRETPRAAGRTRCPRADSSRNSAPSRRRRADSGPVIVTTRPAAGERETRALEARPDAPEVGLYGRLAHVHRRCATS